ncbi:MAG: 50S ribosomal protein L18e [Candidatus Bilamarchaeaceae archaeon]
MKSGIENRRLLALISELKKADKGIWKRVAYELSKPTRRRPEVNLSKLEEYGKDGETIVVPGKVLGSGYLTKRVSVAAFAYSESAKALIAKSGGRMMGIADLLKENPEGKNVRILV